MRIVFRYLAIQDVVDFALQTLRDRSPVGSTGDQHPGLYRDSHMVFLNGHVVEDGDVSAWRRGDQINISNPVPYSRKIEAGRDKLSVPGHVYEDAADRCGPVRQPGRGQVHVHAGPVRRRAGLCEFFATAAAWP